MSYFIEPDIAAARTLPGAFYADREAFAAMRDRVFARSWQWLGSVADVAAPQSLSPRDLLPGMLDEPLLLARDAEGSLRCLSNVCTHRGNILVSRACSAKEIRCGYHSRRFDLAGRMTFMPEFGGVKDFPSGADDLPRVALGQWAGHAFASLDPAAPFDEVFADVREAMARAPVEGFAHDPSRDRDYEVRAHWALYVENYLEGFHIPFVHAGLNAVVDYGAYRSQLCRWSNVQVAATKDGVPAAQYWWIFPNLMLNFYPWGLSLNLVEPLDLGRTRVKFRSFVGDASRLGEGAGASLDRVEAEDEAIVEAVQRGVRSRLYERGRYSPTREQGVHHFHRLLTAALGPMRNL
ncbi:MAG TPA: SRPBCC family protein [Usitatibacter sp.]|nr:SRPBCC family protein [Usitatibacter sp.]